MGATSGSWLDSLWNGVTGTFDKWIDYDNLQFEQKMAQDRLAAEQQIASYNAPQPASWAPVTASTGMDSKTLLIGAVVLVGGYLVAKKLKVI